MDKSNPSSGGLGTTNNQQPQTSTMFPSLNQPQASSNSTGLGGSAFGGGLTMGQGRNLQPQTIPGVKIDVANLRGTTRFNDLHEELQKQIEHMDNVIQGQIKLKNDCNAIMAPHDSQLATVPADVEFLRRKLVGLESSMAADAEAISHVREFIKSDAENAKLSFRAIDNLKLPPQYHVSGVWPPKPSSRDGRVQNGSESDVHDIVGFFSSNADELSATLAKYRKHIGEIEQHLRSVEESSAQQINSLIARRNDGSNRDEDEIRQLAYALTEFEQSILHVAGKVGGLREGIQKLQLGNFMGAVNGRSTNGYRNSVY
jgi:nucleoporin p58/p45